MTLLNTFGSSSSGRCSAKTVAFLAQFLFASATYTTQPSVQTYNLPTRPPYPTDERNSQSTQCMAVAYFVSGIVFAGLITSFYQKRGSPTSNKAICTRTKNPKRTKHPNFLQVETLDYRRPDHSDKIEYWETYQNNFLETFKPTEPPQDDIFQINVLLVDSGIDIAHKAFAFREQAGLIQPWRDYTTNSMELDGVSNPKSSLVDEFGHGTCGADIIGSIAESAVIYSARVSKGGSEVDPRIVAKAINDAVNNAQDIEFQFIIMPLGFPEDSEGLGELEEAINSASQMGITLIAPAGNEGNCRNPSPPACYSPVICALSCDGNGTPSGFSPSIYLNTKDKMEFLVPGEGIECAWIQPGQCHRQQRNLLDTEVLQLDPEEKSGFTYVSGTSFACSVLGGISMVTLERLYEIAVRVYKNSDYAKQQVDRARRHRLQDILGQMERPERGAYLLVPTQVTDEILEKYI